MKKLSHFFNDLDFYRFGVVQLVFTFHVLVKLRKVKFGTVDSTKTVEHDNAISTQQTGILFSFMPEISNVALN